MPSAVPFAVVSSDVLSVVTCLSPLSHFSSWVKCRVKVRVGMKNSIISTLFSLCANTGQKITLKDDISLRNQSISIQLDCKKQ